MAYLKTEHCKYTMLLITVSTVNIFPFSKRFSSPPANIMSHDVAGILLLRVELVMLTKIKSFQLFCRSHSDAKLNLSVVISTPRDDSPVQVKVSAAQSELILWIMIFYFSKRLRREEVDGEIVIE